jgi:hypothetical protein
MVFDLIEMTEGLQMPPSDHGGDSLKSSAADLIALSIVRLFLLTGLVELLNTQ